MSVADVPDLDDSSPPAPDDVGGGLSRGERLTLDLTEGDDAKKAATVIQDSIAASGAKSGTARDRASAETKESATTLTEEYLPEKARDDTRQTITLWLIGLFCTAVVLSFAGLFIVGLKSPGGFDGGFFDRLKTLLDVLLGPVIALLSSAIGFYFGSRQAAAEAARPGPGGAGMGAPNPRTGR